MDNKRKFQQALGKLLKNGDQTTDWQSAIIALYDQIIRWSKEFDKAEPGSFEWSLRLYMVQQLMCFTPLSSLLFQLAEDDYPAIRIAAKAELCDRIGKYSNDSDVAKMAQANLVFMLNTDLSAEAQQEIWENEAVSNSIQMLKYTGFIVLKPGLTAEQVVR